jgi:hypothetical protein
MIGSNFMPNNVHVYLRRCLLPSCDRPFTPKRKAGKPQKFCSPGCRKLYFKKARKVGEAALNALKEPQE